MLSAQGSTEKPRLRNYAYHDSTVRDYIHWLLTQAEIVADLPQLHVVTNDPKDDPVIATAVAAKANFLVTGDRAHLLPIRQYQGIRIVNPKDFMGVIN